MSEQVPADEAASTQALIALLRQKMQRENPATMHRDAHPKQHGLVRGSFEVASDLPLELAIGVFQPGAQYDTWVRFSNQSAPPRHDQVKDIRGVGLKLMSVPGEKIPLGDGNTTSQDFILISTPVFVTHNVREFAQLIKALNKGKLWLLLFFLFHPRGAFNLIKSNKRFFSPLEAHYFSATPYKFGDRVVKYKLAPHTSPTPLSGKLDENYLRNNMARQLNERAYAFDFCVQFRTHPATMPVEDPGKLWQEKDAPFIKLATLTIPQQIFDDFDQDRFGRDLSFSPWHALPAHKPLGGINRARKAVYDALSEFRHKQNQTERFEPVSFEQRH